MLNRYPDQASARKGYVLVGTIFLIFGLAMFLFEDAVMATVGIFLGLVFLVSAVFFEYAAFQKVERILNLFVGL